MLPFSLLMHSKMLVTLKAIERLDNLSQYFALLATGEMATTGGYDPTEILKLLYRLQDLVSALQGESANWRDYCEVSRDMTARLIALTIVCTERGPRR